MKKSPPKSSAHDEEMASSTLQSAVEQLESVLQESAGARTSAVDDTELQKANHTAQSPTLPHPTGPTPPRATNGARTNGVRSHLQVIYTGQLHDDASDGEQSTPARIKAFAARHSSAARKGPEVCRVPSPPPAALAAAAHNAPQAPRGTPHEALDSARALSSCVSVTGSGDCRRQSEPPGISLALTLILKLILTLTP